MMESLRFPARDWFVLLLLVEVEGITVWASMELGTEVVALELDCDNLIWVVGEVLPVEGMVVELANELEELNDEVKLEADVKTVAFSYIGLAVFGVIVVVVVVADVVVFWSWV